MAAVLIPAVLALGLAMHSSAAAESQKTPPPTAAPTTTESKTDTPAQPQLAPQAGPAAAGLLQVKRIFVEGFGDDAASKQIQAMVVTSLTESKRFIVTENKDRADAILRGSGLEKSSQEVHAYSDSTGSGPSGWRIFSQPDQCQRRFCLPIRRNQLLQSNYRDPQRRPH